NPRGTESPAHHFLDLLWLKDEGENARVLAALPVDRIREMDLDLLVYRVESSMPEGKVLLEALVDAKTKRLHTIRTRLEKAGKSEIIGALTVIAYDEPIDAAKFVVADTLTED